MLVDAEIKLQGFEVLTKYLGLVDAERFVALIQREKFDYAKWRQKLLVDLKKLVAHLWVTTTVADNETPFHYQQNAFADNLWSAKRKKSRK